MTLIWVCSAWLLGIFVADSLGLPQLPLALVAGATVLLAPVWRRSRAFMPLVLLAAFALGGVRLTLVRPANGASAVWAYVDQRVVVVGSINQQPIWRDTDQVVVLDAEQLWVDDVPHSVQGLIRLELGPAPALQYGQRIKATGRLEPPGGARSTGFQTYLARHNIYVAMVRPNVEVQGLSRTLSPIVALHRLNAHMQAKVQRLLPEPHAALLAGLLLGTQSAIPRPVLQDFRATGTSHLLVISGWNISVLIGAVIGGVVTLGASRRLAVVLTLPLLVAYVVFVGSSPAVLRAGVMGALVLWAELADREAEVWTGLLFACGVLALADPQVVWDIGFQLSALGTAGVIAWSTGVRGRIRYAPTLYGKLMSGITDAVGTTTMALLFCLPVQLYQFGTVSLITPLANLIVAPAVPFAMLFGGSAAMVALVSLSAGQALGLLAWPFTLWMLRWTSVFATLSVAMIRFPVFPGWLVLVWYGGLAAIAWWWMRRQQRVAAP